MNYLIYVAIFGVAVLFFLWLRDVRIFYRTGKPGYRKAAYQGVLFGALALLGAMITAYSENLPLVGLGIILGALYLQGRIQREKVWTDESTWERFFGSVKIASRVDKKELVRNR
jgi:hypothetical protein